MIFRPCQAGNINRCVHERKLWTPLLPSILCGLLPQEEVPLAERGPPLGFSCRGGPYCLHTLCACCASRSPPCSHAQVPSALSFFAFTQLPRPSSVLQLLVPCSPFPLPSSPHLCPTSVPVGDVCLPQASQDPLLLPSPIALIPHSE